MALERVVKHLTMAPLTITGEEVGTGDGTNAEFTLDDSNVQDGSLTVYVDGVEQTLTTDYTVALSTGVITFESGSIPPNGEAVTADYISGLTITGEEVGTGDGTNAEFTLDYSNVCLLYTSPSPRDS